MKKTAAVRDDQTLIAILTIALCMMALWAISCGGGGGGTPSTPSPTPTPSGSSSGAVGGTVTLTANGVSEATPRIANGQRIRFTNNDNRVHQIMSTPHGTHTDCPEINAIGSLSPGQSGMSDTLSGTRGCGFHDHLAPDDTKFRGQVLVGISANDPAPPDPYYVR